MNVSNATIKAIHELNGEMFAMNRFWDATVSTQRSPGGLRAQRGAGQNHRF